MKKLLLTILFVSFGFVAHAQFQPINVNQGGTGLNSIANYGWLAGTGGLRLTASTSPTVGYLIATSTTATSTFYGATQVNGMASTSLLSVSGTATTTFTSGVNVRTGCFAVNNTCVGGSGGAGTVTSVDMSVPTGLTVSGNPITTSGTLALALGAGRIIPIQANELSTSSVIAQPQVLYATGVNTVASAATSTLSGTAPINVPAGTYVIGAGGNITCTTASSGTTGCLSGTDWTTFNSKIGNFDWNKQTTYNVLSLTPTTTIPVWFKDQVFASSSAIFDGNVKANSFTATSSGSASTPAYNFLSHLGTGMWDNAGDVAFSVVGAEKLEIYGNGVEVLASGIPTQVALAIGSDLGLGLYSSAASTLNFVTGGVDRGRFDANGLFGVGTSSPWRTLSVRGSSDLGVNALAGFFTATTTTSSVFPYASTTALTVSTTASTTNLVVSSGGGVGIRCAQFQVDGTLNANASACGGTGSPAGATSQVQYNSNGAFAAVSTTTLIAGTNISYSGGTPVIIGSSPVTINATSGGTKTATVPISCNTAISTSTSFYVGGVWYGPVQFNNLDIFTPAAWDFSAGTSSAIACIAHMPENLANSPTTVLNLVYSATSTSKVAVPDVYVSLTNPQGGTYDPAFGSMTNIIASTTANTRISTPATSGVATTSQTTFTTCNTAGQDCLFWVGRYGKDVSDTASDLYLLNQYITTTVN